jgi:hypothetical protein
LPDSDGITHIIIGGGSAPCIYKRLYAGFYHFVEVTVEEDNVYGEVVDIICKSGTGSERG